MKAKADTKVPVWACPYCKHLIEAHSPIDGIDHMLDEHRAELIAEHPLIIRKRKP